MEITRGFQVHETVVRGRGGKVVCACAANRGYLDGRISFSCRVVHRRQGTPSSRKVGAANGSKRSTTHPVNSTRGDIVALIALLKEYASKDDWVLARTGVDFANGHKQATGDNLPVEVWERFKETCLEIVTKEMLAERRRLGGGSTVEENRTAQHSRYLF